MNLLKKLKLMLFPRKLTYQEEKQVYAFFDEHDRVYSLYDSHYNQWSINQALAGYLNEKHHFDVNADFGDTVELVTVNLSVSFSQHDENLFLISPYDRGGSFMKSYHMKLRDTFHYTFDHLLSEILEENQVYTPLILEYTKEKSIPEELFQKILDKMEEEIYQHYMKKFAEDYIDWVEDGGIYVTSK